MNKKYSTIVIGILILSVAVVMIYRSNLWKSLPQTMETDANQLNYDDGLGTNKLHELTIQTLRQSTYPGSDLTIEEELTPGVNYSRYLVSYRSEGLKIYALLTVPDGEKPESGWPVIVFNHGYIPPQEYRTTERYIAYTDGFSRNGYILIRPDYRGHGNSEGTASGAYGSNDYTIDVLNALSSIRRFKEADQNRIGMWGHSMGGFITLRAMVVNKNIKAGVIWGGVVASFPDLLNNWRRRSTTPPPGIPTGARRWRDQLVTDYGRPEKNPDFWNSISANSFLNDISGPLELHHGTADVSVPVAFSEALATQLKLLGKGVELFTYTGDDHNISINFSLAMKRSVEFFDKYMKENNTN